MEDRLAAALPAAIAPPAAAIDHAEPVPPQTPADEEAAPWPEGATTVEIIKAPADDVPAAEAAAPRPAVHDAPLPSLDTMVARIPQDVRDALDDLFRVKFINVQRMPASTLKQ